MARSLLPPLVYAIKYPPAVLLVVLLTLKTATSISEAGN